MAVSNADIQAWTAANPAASQQDIYNAMQQHGVTPTQLAQATGWDANAINTQYAALSQPAVTTQQSTTPSNYMLSSLPENGLNPSFGLDGMNVKKFMDATGADFQTASDMLYGNVGSNKDYRNWQAIMSSSNPLQAAKDATMQMYGGGYNVNYLYDPEYKQYTTQLYSKDGTALTSIGGGKTLAEAQDPSRWSGYQRFGVTDVSQLTGGGNVYNYDPKTYNPYMNRTQDSPYMNLTSSNPNFQTPQQQPPSYVNNAFPQYTPDYGNLTQQPTTQPQYTPTYANNALMRPVTQNSNITAQNQYGNMGYNNQRSSLWGDW